MRSGSSRVRKVRGQTSRQNEKQGADLLQSTCTERVTWGVIESLDATGRPNITGTYNRMTEEVTVRTIRSYKPDFQHLGLVYHVNEKNSVLKRNEMAALAERLDFRFTSVELPLGGDGTPDPAQIAAALEQLKQQGVDFVYLGSSSFLQEHADAFTGAAVENGLPVLSPYEQLVRESQALLSVSARYYDVGRLAGEQAEKILVQGFAPGELPVARMTDFAVVINVTVAKRLNQFPPLDLVQIAETVN
jgi:putative tryptophan/tyrosine transport system substrate-binding protein